MKLHAPTIVAALALVFAPPAVAQRGGAAAQSLRDVRVTAIADVIAPGAMWSVAWQGTDNADGIVGTADGGLLFAQEQPRRISKLDAMDRVSVVLAETRGVGSIALDSKGRVLAVERTCTDPGGRPEQCTESPAVSVLTPARTVIAERFAGKPLGRLNDFVVDGKGAVYFTVGGAYYVTAGGTVRSLGENIRANGIMLSRDETILYVTNGDVELAVGAHFADEDGLGDVMVRQHFRDTAGQVRRVDAGQRVDHLVGIGGAGLLDRLHPHGEADDMRFHRIVGHALRVLRDRPSTWR